MIKIQFGIYFLIILLVFTKVTFSLTSTSYDFIFQQLQFPPQLLEKSAQISSTTSNKDYTVIAFLQGGIKWIDNAHAQPIEYAQISLSGTTISAIAITKHSQYLFTSSDNKLSMYSVSIQENFKLTQVKQSKEQYGVITNIYLIQEDRIAILLGDKGSIIAYDVQSKSKQDGMPILASYYAASKNIMGFIRITDDLKWIFISDLDKGVFILRLSINIDQSGNVSSVTMPLAASAYARYTNQVEVSKDLQQMIILESWRGLRVIPLANLHAADPSTYPIVLPNKDLWWINPLMQPVFYGSYVSKDSKYLITAIRSQGMIIFDISNPSNPVFYYQIQISGCPTRIEMVDGQNLLYYTDGISILAFQRVQPNMNDQFPNVFNGHQSKLFQYSSSFAQWRCYVSQEQTFVIATQCGDVDFLQLKGGDPYNISLFKRISAIQNTRTCTMVFDQNNRYMYRPVRENGAFLYIYDIQNIANYSNSDFPIVGQANDSNPPRGEDLVFSQDGTLLVVNYGQGIIIYDSTNKFALKSLSYWFIPLELNGWPSAIALSDDNKYCVVASRTIGTFFLLDISDKSKPILINKLYTNGAELIVKSSIYNVAYVCDGTAGFAIMDFSALPQFKFISRISVDGWANHITLIQNEKYAIISSMDYNGMISIIDLTDLANPFVVSKYIENEEQSIANCVLNSLDYGFSTSNKGLRIFPLKSQIAIHSSFFEKQSNLQLKAITNNLKIGQVVQIQMLLIYATDGMQIQEVYYYDNYQRNPLPNWIQFIKINNSIQILVDKKGFKQQFAATQNILLVQTGVPIKKTSFIYPEIPTDLAASQLIYESLKEKGIINSNDMLSSTFDPNNSINLSSLALPQSQRLNDLVHLTLQRGIYYNPITFTVSKSLEFNPNKDQGMISTYSPEVRVQITVNSLSPQAGTFVLKQYPGVIVSISDNRNSILIYGTVEAVNSILKSQISYFQDPNFANSSDFQVVLVISDGLNEDLVIKHTFQQALSSYIHSKSRIIQTVPLQDQIKQQFSDSEITVLEQTSIALLSSTFHDQDSFPITYTVFIKDSSSKDGYITLPSDYWLKFQPASLVFNGIAQVSLLNSRVTIKIVASDGYSQATDEFTLKLSKLPLSYVLNLLISILTPVLSLIGIYKYKYLIINYLYHKATIYSKETIYVNQQYVKIIPLLDQNVLLASSIIKQYIKELESKKKEKSLIQESNNQNNQLTSTFSALQNQKLQNKIDSIEDLKIPEYLDHCSRDGRVDMFKLISDMDKMNLTYKFSGVLRNFNKDREFILLKNETLLFESIKILMSRYILSKDAYLNNFYNYLKQRAIQQNKFTKNDWYKEYVTIGSSETEEQKLSISLDTISMNLVFSNFKSNDESILNAFQLMKKNYNGDKKLLYLESQRLNLLKDILVGDAIGIVDQKLGYYQKCVGESLWLGMHNIMGVQAHIRDTDSCLLPLKSCLNCDHLPYGIQNNMKLPNWLTFIHKGGLIVLKGVPTEADIETFQIRISDIRNYTVRKYDISILPSSHNVELITKSESNEVTEQNKLLKKLTNYNSSNSKSLSLHSLLQKAYLKASDISPKLELSIQNPNQISLYPKEVKKVNLIQTPMVGQQVIETNEELEEVSSNYKGSQSPQFMPRQFIFASKQQNLNLLDAKNSKL